MRTRVTQFSKEEKPSFVSVIFYFSTEYTGWIKSLEKPTKTSSVLTGNTEDVNDFKVKVEVKKNPEQIIFLDYAIGNVSVVHLKEKLVNEGYFQRISTKMPSLKEYFGFKKELNSDLEDASFVAYQVSGFLPFEFDVIFESQSLRTELNERNLEVPPELKGEEFDSLLGDWHGKFSMKFEDTFKLKEKNFSSNAILMAQSTLSNLLGGIGFFSGRSIVKSHSNKEPVLYWQSNLYTAVPSRSFFPRGFLWDEGFHNILISEWDLEITKDILGHWLDLMNIEGWIPREVILGEEVGVLLLLY